MNRIIAVASQARNGKDTMADYIAIKLDGYKRESLAGNVKRIFCETFGVDKEFIENWKTKTDIPDGYKKNIRKSLQFIGDGFREIRDDVWINLLFNKINHNCIVSDVRYISEANYVNRNNGVIVLVYRNGFDNNDTNLSEAEIKPLVDFMKKTKQEGCVRDILLENQRNMSYFKKLLFKFGFGHPPKALENFDLFILNDGTIEDYYKKIDDIVLPYINEKFS